MAKFKTTSRKSTNTFKKILEALLKTDSRLADEHKELNLSLLRELADKTDEKFIELLLSNEDVKKKFFLPVSNVLVFKQTDFKFFLDASQIDNSYTAYENRIGLSSNSRLLKDSGDVVLNFPYKDCVLQGGQSTEEGMDEYFEYDVDAEKYELASSPRKEIFFNEVLAQDEIDRLYEPKAFTNIKKYTAKGEEKFKAFTRDEAGRITDNLIIKGNNLLALHSLKEEFAGRVKLIYIDPPYNTGNDGFKYNDNFSHSTWLTFMKNRLEAASELLSDEGSIWMNADDGEAHYLKVLGDEIFQRKNFVANIIWQKKFAPQNDAKYFSDNHDHILVFAKNKNNWKLNLLTRSEENKARYANPDNDPRGNWTSGDLTVKTYAAEYDYPITTPSGKIINPPKGICWRVSKEKFKELAVENRVWFGKDGNNVPRLKRFLTDVKEGITPLTIWLHAEVGHNQEAKQELNKLGLSDIFKTPKPERLLKNIIHLATRQGDIVLDFFAGSGTAAAVAMKMKRRFILCEQMEYVKTVTIERIDKVIKGTEGIINKDFSWQGGGSFTYLELKQSNEEAKDKITSCKTFVELQQLTIELSEKYFLNYNVRFKEFQEKTIHETVFKKLPFKKQQEMFAKMLDLNQLYVAASEMEDKKYGLSKEDIALTKNFYNL